MNRRALLAIVAVFAAGWTLVSPWKDAPVIDDWVYAWGVQHLLKTGQLRVLDYSSVYPIAQTLWGAAFAIVPGFSFAILRVSTVVLAAAGCYAIYLTLRELDVDPRASLVAALAVALSPVYFALSFTFMTDVPFVSVSAIALYFYVSGAERGEPRRIWWGSLAAVIAFFIRPLALVLPVAALAGSRPGQWKWAARRVLPPLALALVVMAAGWIALPRLLGRLSVADSRVEGLKYLAWVTPREYASWNIEMLVIAAFPFAPVLLASLASARRAAAIAAVSAAIAGVSWLVLGHLSTPLPHWQTWSLEDLAARGGLLGGDLQPPSWAVRLTPVLAVIGTITAGSLLVCAAIVCTRARRGTTILLAVALLHVLLFNVLWFFNDRYYLVLAPSLAYFAAAPLGGRRWNARLMWLAAPLLALWGFVSITGTRDMIATNDVVARLVRDLEASGVPPYDIDGGYSSNGWRLYAHPERLRPRDDPHYDVPFVTSGRQTPYGIVNVPANGDEVLRVALLPAALWQVTDRVFVVRRTPR